MKRNIIQKLVCLAIAAVISASVAAQQGGQDPFADLPQWTFGKSREPLAKIEEIIRKTDPTGYPEIEKKLVSILKEPGTTKDAKRYICRWLVIVGSDACVDIVADLLTDPDLSHPARMVLEPMKSEKAGAALRNALPKLNGKLLAGVIGSIGVRRDVNAISELAKLANNTDQIISETAMAALGNIGTDASAQVLEKIKPSKNLERAWARSLATAAARLAEAGDKKRASELFSKLFAENQPPPVRLAACVGLVNNMSRDNAVEFLITQLKSKDIKIQRAALSALRMCPDVEVSNAVANRLTELDSDTQVLALGIFTDLENTKIRQAALKLAQTAIETRVRVAALRCLAKHGEADDVVAIATIATSNPELANEVTATLQNMGKPGVDAAILKLIESKDAAQRSIAVNVLASRRVESVLPDLIKMLKSQDAALAAEAARAIGIVGKPEHVSELATVAANTENQQLRDSAVNAIKSIVRKTSDKAKLSPVIIECINKAKNIQNKTALFQILVLTAGNEALDFVVKSLNSDNNEIKTTAFETLVSWNEDTAVPHLLEIAKNSADEKRAIVALRDGLLRLAELEDISPVKRAQILQEAFKVAKRQEEKKRIISILGEIPALNAIETLRVISENTEFRNDCHQAIIKLARQVGAVYPEQTINILEQVKSTTQNDEIRKQAEQTINAVKNAGLSMDGYILAWLIVGPFTKEGKDGNALFSEVFPPEQAGSKVDWKPYTVPANKKAGLVEFDKMNSFKGENRVAYLRTTIVSETDQNAMLEVGSDDGVKIWLNGKVVHSNNTVRPCSPGQDKVKIKLNKGNNTLLIKVTQGGGEWALSCRICSPDGKPLSNITIMPKLD